MNNVEISLETGTKMAAPSARERRRNRRHRAKAGTAVVCRKGALGLGRNLGLRLLDVSEDGARLIVAAPLNRGDEAEVGFTPPGFGKSFTRMADVVRCLPLADGTFEIAVRFQKMLSYSEVCHLF